MNRVWLVDELLLVTLGWRRCLDGVEGDGAALGTDFGAWEAGGLESRPVSSEEARFLFHLLFVLLALVLRVSRAGVGGVLSPPRAWAGGSESRDDDDDVNSELELAVEEPGRAIAMACGGFWAWGEETGRAAVEAPLSGGTG